MYRKFGNEIKNGTVNDENQPLSNPKGVSILTTVVGFGKDFTNATGTNANDVAAAREWGTVVANTIQVVMIAQ